MASIRITTRLIVKNERAFGTGKALVLEAVAAEGSISKAAKALDMSYSRAWQLVDGMNQSFRKPLIESTAGGKKGGGATLTALGKEVLALFRKMEKQLAEDAETYLGEFEKRLK